MTRDERRNLKARRILEDPQLLAVLVDACRVPGYLACILRDVPDESLREDLRMQVEAKL